METTTATKRTTALFDRRNSQLENPIFQHGHHYVLCISLVMNKNQHAALVKMCTSSKVHRVNPLFQSCYEHITPRKMYTVLP